MSDARNRALALKRFLAAAESLAQQRRKVWSPALRREVRKCWLVDAPVADRIAAACVLVNEAKDLPPLPPLTADDMLAALERAAVGQGLTPTLALRADLRAAIANKPPPPVAHARVVETFRKHKQIQQLTMIGQEMRH